MIGYHVTTEKKVDRYIKTGCILSPVRFWNSLEQARAWARKTGRGVVLMIYATRVYPLPDHKPRGTSWWADENVRHWVVARPEEEVLK